MIHGKASSVGCVAVGDEAIEELFVLANDVGKESVLVIIAPRRPDIGAISSNEAGPPWLGELHAQLYEKLCKIRGC